MELSREAENLPSVSVIIPCYNSNDTIAYTLKSLAEQDYKGNIEVIAVDDGSTDGTPEVAKRYTSKVFVQSNRGPGVARNHGAKESTGEILIFTDSDCVPIRNFVSEMVRPLCDPKVSGVQGRFKCRDTKLLARFVQLEGEERDRRKAKVDNVYWVATHSACYRRDVFLEYGGFHEDSFARAEDFELSQRLVDQGHKMVFNPKAIVFHRHPATIRKYLAAKFARSYWMIWLYSEFPRRIIDDPITPLLRKLMMVFLALGVISVPFAIIWLPIAYLCIASWVLLLASTIPFTVRALVKDPMVALIAPWLMILRSAVFIAGFGSGIWDYAIKRKFDRVSY